MKLNDIDQELAEKLQPYDDDLCGVYILSDEDGEIVYVGQSKNIPQRIVEHRKEKNFSSVHFVRVSRDQLKSFEALLIKQFKPSLNKVVGLEFPNDTKGRAAYMRSYRRRDYRRTFTCVHCGYTWTQGCR